MMSVPLPQPNEGDLLCLSDTRVLVVDDAPANVGFLQHLRTRDPHRIITTIAVSPPL
jgi:hypothetical protein